MSNVIEGVVEMPNAKKQEVTTRQETPQPVATSEAGAILSMIERAAKDPAVDIDKMERLMRMRNDMIEREQERAFFEAMGRVQSKLPQVVRDADNDHTKSKYARLETISKAITPIITEHGFSTSFGTDDCPKEGHYRITCLLGHSSGYSRDYHADLPADVAGAKGTTNKPPIQGFGSTMSYGRRYLKCLIFDVALKDEDDDGNSASAAAEGPIGEEQTEEIRKLLETTDSDVALFCRAFKIDKIADLPAKRFGEAKMRITGRKR